VMAYTTHCEGGAPPSVVRCYRRFLAESEGSGHGHCLGTAVPRAVHHPIFPEGKGFVGLAWVVTATLSGDQRLAVEIRPLGEAPSCLVPSQKPAALLQRLYLDWGL
jgi:hypothetical protein